MTGAGSDAEDTADARRAAGDLAAFSGIVLRWQARLINLAWRFCHDRTDAEEMAQEAFVRAFRGIHTFRGESSFSTWLTAIAMNCYRSWLRDRAPVPLDIDLTRAYGHEPDALSQLQSRERDAAIRRAVLTLPPRYRDPMVLFYFEERNLAETARVLDLPEGTVKARLHRAPTRRTGAGVRRSRAGPHPWIAASATNIFARLTRRSKSTRYSDGESIMSTNPAVNVKCFGCDALIEAADSDAAVDAFVAHGRQSHTWSYPEQAVRTYARNYAEATERLTGRTERLPEIAEIAVYPVTSERVDDWLRFMDHDAFAGNPDWASCYCLEPHIPATPDEPERAWRTTRSRVTERLKDGTTFGYLAYVDGCPAGWVNASLRSDYGLFRIIDPDGPGPTSVVGVSCFVIAPPFRRHGVASALLDRVLADAAGRCAAWIEAYPHNKPAANDAGHFRGPRSMYDARGFEPIEVREHDTVMRRSAKATRS